MRLLQKVLSLFIVLVMGTFAYSQTVYPAKQKIQKKPKIVISDKGVGPINEKTLFEYAEIQRLFPGLVVKKVEDGGGFEDMGFPIINVLDKGQTLITINPVNGNNDDKRIYSVVVKSNLVENSLGAKIGSTYAQIYKSGISSNCKPGMEQDSGTIIDQDPNSKHVRYVFEGEWNGEDGSIPPFEVLKTWKITEIIWNPVLLDINEVRFK
ncbi:MAG: DUF1131 family protein [Elusimicrobiota bacterium]